MPTETFEIPEQMRDVADKSVDQARKAFDQFMDATQKAVAKAEGSAKSLQEGAADLSRQTLAYIEENVAASFKLAANLVQARTVLQQEFLRRQMAAAAEQGKSLGGMVGRATQDAVDKTKK